MKITAVKGKSAVFVLDWGKPPLAIEQTKRGRAFVPSGFTVEVKSDAKVWIAQTRVEEQGQAEYQFTLKEEPEIQSEWKKNPTAAYKEVNEKACNDKFVKGSNGRLIIGVTYENLQREIKRKFQTEISDIEAELSDETECDTSSEASRKRRLSTSSSQSSPVPMGLGHDDREELLAHLLVSLSKDENGLSRKRLRSSSEPPLFSDLKPLHLRVNGTSTLKTNERPATTRARLSSSLPFGSFATIPCESPIKTLVDVSSQTMI